MKHKIKRKQIMATRTVFLDNEKNEMNCFLNSTNEVFIEVGQPTDEAARGQITLDKEDVKQLIKILSGLEKQMTE